MPAPLDFYRSNIRWLGAGFALAASSSFGQTFFISLFAGEIRAEFGLSDGDWGAIYTAATLASAAALYQTGVLVDRIAPGRLAVGVMLLYAAAALGMSAVSQWWMLIGLVFLLRLCGQGMMSHIAITTMGRWFRAHRGRAVAFAGLGFSAGEALLPSLAVLGIGLLGWRGAWGAVALVLALLAAPLIAWLLAEGRRPKGLAAQDEHPGIGGRHWQRREVLRHWSFWTLVPAVLTPAFIGTVVFFQQVHIAEVKGWSLETMAAGYPLYAATTMAAALVAGGLVDRLGPLRLLGVFLGPLILGTAVLGSGDGVATWFATLALLGLSQGTAQAMWGALWPELYGTRHLGAVRSVSTTAMVFSTAAGPGITGVLIDAGIDFPAQCIWLAAWALLVSAIGALAARGIAAMRNA
ncbi:MAG: MFS transporter [Pseudomonadota bacterium]